MGSNGKRRFETRASYGRSLAARTTQSRHLNDGTPKEGRVTKKRSRLNIAPGQREIQVVNSGLLLLVTSVRSTAISQDPGGVSLGKNYAGFRKLPEKFSLEQYTSDRSVLRSEQLLGARVAGESFVVGLRPEDEFVVVKLTQRSRRETLHETLDISLELSNAFQKSKLRGTVRDTIDQWLYGEDAVFSPSSSRPCRPPQSRSTGTREALQDNYCPKCVTDAAQGRCNDPNKVAAEQCRLWSYPKMGSVVSGMSQLGFASDFGYSINLRVSMTHGMRQC
ncbi:hypothetical protein BIW11_03795 [Tropilaelaps mercedesae]|uniref:Uncharacterized protein n=1 Tax=Tropilaelaps mercedesae TaxID=418985 RepID=A0A1V9XFX6_9ACAR|nr:hypothetical protein BIW11_03795 [Tropilaelaps mercedesae]